MAATELYDVAVLMDQVISRIEACAKKISVIGSTPKDLRPLFNLISHMLELREKVFLLADTDTQSRIRALEITESEIGGNFKKLLRSICTSVDKSTTKVPRGRSFQLVPAFSMFHEMWGNTCQLVSTEAKFLGTRMFFDEPLQHHISRLHLCSEDISWICTWTPQFGEKLHRIEKGEDIVDWREQHGAEMEEGEMQDHGAELEKRTFADYIRSWERHRRRYKHSRFEDCTALSSMLFTHYIPGHSPMFCDAPRTMQIFSIKVTELEFFKWPLEVYGVVAARDVVDYRRNLLFLRTRDDCQLLTEQDSFLHLTGPSRAIMSADNVQIEIQLKVKGTTKSKDRALITKAFSCNGGGCDNFFTRSIHGCFCRIDVRCEHLRQSIQATILSVRVLEGSLPSENGFQVVCSSLPQESPQEVWSSLSQEDTEGKAECVVLIDGKDGTVPEEDAEGKAESKHVVLLHRKDGTMPVDEEGCLVLSRQVVPVIWKGKLEILIKTFPQSGDISACVVFTPELSNISQQKCVVGGCELEITVAWSLLVDDEQHMLMMSYTKPYMVHSPLPFMKELTEDAEDETC